VDVRTRAGRRRRPAAAVADSSSVKASPVARPRRFDGATKVHGVKRHMLVDTSGILVAAIVTPANVQDRAAFPTLLREARRVAPTIRHIGLDKGYTGHVVAGAANRPASASTSCQGQNQPPDSRSSRAGGSSNAPTAGSITAAASTATTKPPSPPTKDSSSSAKSPYCSDDSTAASCSTRFRQRSPYRS